MPILVIPIVVVGAVVLGMVLEFVATGITIEPSRLLAVVLLSPVTLTAGGRQFCFAPSLQSLFFFLGLGSIPTMIMAITFAWRCRTKASYVTLFFVVAFFYFGVIHKHLAVMSV